MSPVRFGIVLGFAVGIANLLHTMLWPLAEDSAAAVLTFYGPVFLLWALSGFLAARLTERWLSGVWTAIVLAFVTALIYDAIVILRVNLFLEDLTQRTDWQRWMREYEASGSSSLRTFINFAYLKDMPLKVAFETGFGVVMGVIGATLGILVNRVLTEKRAVLSNG
jgi:hypothetical protein